MTLIQIQRKNSDTEIWDPIALSKARYSFDSMIVGGRFRILVNHRLVFDSKEAED